MAGPCVGASGCVLWLVSGAGPFDQGHQEGHGDRYVHLGVLGHGGSTSRQWGQSFRGARSSVLVQGSRTLCPSWAHVRVVGWDRCSAVGVEGARPGAALLVGPDPSLLKT